MHYIPGELELCGRVKKRLGVWVVSFNPPGYFLKNDLYYVFCPYSFGRCGVDIN